MANVRNANTFFIDTQAGSSAATDSSNLVEKNIRVTHILAASTGANAVVVLKDVTTNDTKIDFRISGSGDRGIGDFADNPIVFPNGISPTTITNITITCVVRGSNS